MNKSDIATFLSGIKMAVMATINSDGSPHLSPNWYYYDDHQLFFVTTKERKKFYNLERDQRMSVCVYEPPLASDYVVVQGTANVDDLVPTSELWGIARLVIERYVNDTVAVTGANSTFQATTEAVQGAQNEVDAAIHLLQNNDIAVLHCVSTYPTPPEELNLNVLKTFQKNYPNLIIGYSGHETGLSTTYAAVALGAKIVERHITLARAMWGTDHSASIEPQGLKTLVSNIRDIEVAMGDGIKNITAGELPIREKLRRVQ